MRGWTAKRLRAYAEELCTEAHRQGQEANERRTYQHLKRVWKQDAEFRKTVQEAFAK